MFSDSFCRGLAVFFTVANEVEALAAMFERVQALGLWFPRDVLTAKLWSLFLPSEWLLP